MNKSLSQLKTNIGAECQDSGSAFATIIERFINRRYFQILRAINWRNIQPDYTFDTVGGTQRYVLPDDFGKEMVCTDSTNNKELTRTTLEQLYETYQDISDTGTVERYCVIEDCVQAQPTSASRLTIVSSSTADTTQSVLIRGISGGIETYETVTLTGTTDALTSATQTYTRIKGISKSAVTAGKITIDSNSAAVTQAIIPPETLETRYKLILLHYVPTTIATIAIPYIINPMPLSQTYDYPVLDIGDLIEIGALADCWRYKRQFSKAQAMEIGFNQQLQEYIFSQENQPNQIHQMIPTVFNRDDVC
jgi:hypothetical protein